MTINWPELAALAFPPKQPAPVVPVAGKRLCAGHNARTGAPCKKPPVNGATVCLAHGARAPQVRAKARQRVQQARALELARSLGASGEQFSGDPIDALEWVISESHTLTRRLAGIVHGITDADLRYSGKLGEQTRGELTALLRAMRDLSGMSERAIALGISERRLALEERQVTAVEQALVAALEVATGGLPDKLERQAAAGKVLSRELRAIEGGKSG